VVCLAASAALLAGGIAATAAGAETTMGEPAVPGVAMTDVPAIPQLPADPDDAAADRPADPAGAGAQGGPAQPAAEQPDAAIPGLTVPDLAGLEEPAAQDQPNRDQQDQDQQDQDQQAQRPGGPAKPAADPVQQKPAKPAKQRPASNSMAAAQQDVSPDSVSGSVSSPVQQQVLTLVNENRRRGGCDDLSLDRRLIAAANRHASDMARRGYFAHRSPGGEGAGERVEDAGYRWSRYGENIARGQDSPYDVVDGWMHSPEHRENIMDCDLHQMGIGLAFAGDKTPYWVQDFATPR
jgi:uncharacterized protein YkwD